MLLLTLFMTLADTTRSYYLPVAKAESLWVTDAGKGRPVVLIPGIFGSAFGYRRVLPLLTQQGYRAIVIEPLGIGHSTKPERADYSLEAQSGRVEAVLGRLGLTGVMVVAHSTNASIAYRLAYRRPDLVSGVVSLEGGPAERATTAGFRRAMTFVPWIKWFGGAKLIRKQIRKGLIRASGDTSWVTDEVVNGYTAAAQSDLDGTLKAFLGMAASKEPEHLQPHLAAIHCPVWLLLGGAPHDAGPSAKEVATLQAGLAKLSVDTIPGVGHYIQEERPEAVLQAVNHALAAAPSERQDVGAPATHPERVPPAAGSTLQPRTAPAERRW
jgi:pimeloyl-ACP methyl ester carboxylesterase